MSRPNALILGAHPDDQAAVAEGQRRPRVSSGGRRAQQHGDAFEKWLEGQHDAALGIQMLAWWRKTGCAMKKLPGKGWTPVGKGPVDYVLYTPGRRTLIVEAKSFEGARFPRAKVPPHQQDHLERHARANPDEASGALLVLRAADVTGYHVRHFAVPWARVPWVAKVSAEAVYLDDPALGLWEVREPLYLSPILEGRGPWKPT